MAAQPTPRTGLDPEDLAWARDLAASMITATLGVAAGDDDEARSIYRAARHHALSVRTDDGLAADRWLAAMSFAAATAAGLLREMARLQQRDPQDLWQKVLLRRHQSPDR